LTPRILHGVRSDHRRYLYLGLSVAALLAAPARSQTAAPIVVVAHVDVIPDSLAHGLATLRTYAADARHDPGARRIDLLQQVDRPNHFTIVEEWASQTAYNSHVALGHTRQFRTTIQPMLGSPFDERVHTAIR
jgi:quinol monooxygenase YgiN